MSERQGKKCNFLGFEIFFCPVMTSVVELPMFYIIYFL
jgi:hypothetical protein